MRRGWYYQIHFIKVRQENYSIHRYCWISNRGCHRMRTSKIKTNKISLKIVYLHQNLFFAPYLVRCVQFIIMWKLWNIITTFSLIQNEIKYACLGFCFSLSVHKCGVFTCWDLFTYAYEYKTHVSFSDYLFFYDLLLIMLAK